MELLPNSIAMNQMSPVGKSTPTIEKTGVVSQLIYPMNDCATVNAVHEYFSQVLPSRATQVTLPLRHKKLLTLLSLVFQWQPSLTYTIHRYCHMLSRTH